MSDTQVSIWNETTIEYMRPKLLQQPIQIGFVNKFIVAPSNPVSICEAIYLRDFVELAMTKIWPIKFIVYCAHIHQYIVLHQHVEQALMITLLENFRWKLAYSNFVITAETLHHFYSNFELFIYKSICISVRLCARYFCMYWHDCGPSKRPIFIWILFQTLLSFVLSYYIPKLCHKENKPKQNHYV